MHHIQQHFIDSADLQYHCAEMLGAQVASGVQALLAAITGGAKVLCCGSGLEEHLARMFAHACVAGFERERPELAAVHLPLYDSLCGGAGDAPGALCRHIRALGQPGDVLLMLHDRGDAPPGLLHGCATAHERDMTILALTTTADLALAQRLRETDVLIPVPRHRPWRVRELHTLILHCLSDGIDRQLLGDEQETV